MAEQEVREESSEGKGERWATALQQLKNSITQVTFLRDLLGEIVYQAGDNLCADDKKAPGFALQFEGAARPLESILENMGWRKECAEDAVTIAEAKDALELLGCFIRVHGIFPRDSKWGGLEILTSGLVDKLYAALDNMNDLGYPEEPEQEPIADAA